MAPIAPVTDIDPATRIVCTSTPFDGRLRGVPSGEVRLSWQVESSRPGAAQEASQIRTRTPGGPWQELPVVVGPSQVGVVVPAPAPGPREVREYSVRIATDRGWSTWGEPARFEAGVAGSELTASVIDIPSVVGGPVPILRTEFDLDTAVDAARLRISALGVYDVRVNGIDVTDGILAPGWTAYQERILLDTLDVAAALRPGRNAIAIRVADGWFRGRMGFAGRAEIYGSRIGAIAQLEVGLGADAVTLVQTDASWRGGFGSVTAASIYDGTRIDHTLYGGDPSTVGFDDSSWAGATVVPFDTARLEPRGVPPVRVVAELPMSASFRDGVTQLDAGQNVSGWVRLTVEGRRGDVVTVRHAEVLESDGALHVAALRTARATDEYVLGADGVNDLEPVFTFHGFRYADVTGPVNVVSATAVAISSDLPSRSRLRTSHAVLDRFHENVRWSQLDNFVSLPTDCPQRDERLGWTGDAQAFAATSATLFDTRAFWMSWLRDLEIEQSDDLGVPSIVPNILVWGDMQTESIPAETMGRAGWADAATIVPLAVYDAFGDVTVLERQLSSMRRWVDHLRRRAGDAVLLPQEPFQYGDWLDPDAPGDKPWMAKVDSLFVANAFYVHSARLLARAEWALGHPEAAAEHDELADRVAAAVWQRWGAVAGDTQTGAAMCLRFGIVPDAERDELGDRLAREVRREDGRIATGFLGTPLVLDALSSTGHLAEAYLMLLRRDAPSWLYQVDRGATTVWERWDAILPDGSIHNGQMGSKEGDSMLSFNHYAYGAMIDWVYRNVAGLAPERPGYALTRVAPRPADDLRSAAASIDTPYGELAIEWMLGDDDGFQATVRVPFGVEAILDLPIDERSTVSIEGTVSTADRLTAGTHRVRVDAPVIVRAGTRTAPSAR